MCPIEISNSDIWFKENRVRLHPKKIVARRSTSNLDFVDICAKQNSDIMHMISDCEFS